MVPLSVLDLAPIVEGGDAGRALRNCRDLARHVERLGFHRYWLAEHHNMPGVASSATAVALCWAAEGTRAIRIGAGGVMLPNHAPLVIAEQFGSLAALYPGRIDLGVGRAPGTDLLAARALRRSLDSNTDRFPQDVVELLAYFEPAAPGAKLRAVPGAGLDVDVWILGSSLYGAQVAAALGLPFAFASHFAPACLDAALALYRERFEPSPRLAQPYAMAAVNVFVADREDEADLLFSSHLQAVANLRSGRPGPLPPPRRGVRDSIEPELLRMIEASLSCSVIGGPAKTKAGLDAFLERTGADELIVAGQIYDHSARRRSFEILAAACGLGPVGER